MTTETKNKRGMGAKVPALRFPEFSGPARNASRSDAGGEWEEKRLGEVGDLKNGYAFKSSSYKENGQFKIVTIGNVQNGKLNTGKMSAIDKIPEDIQDHQMLAVSDMLVSMTGNVGRVCLVDEKNCLLNQRVGNVILTNKAADRTFVYQRLNRPEFEFRMQSLAQGGAQGNISKGDILSFKFFLPLLPEQQKIVGALGVVDEKIEGLTKKKKSLERYKKGVMQKIFSQNIRFKPTRNTLRSDVGGDENGNQYPDWEEKKLGEIGTTYNGLAGKSGEDFGDGEPFITYKQIFDNSTIDTQKFARVKIGTSEKQNRAQFGDVFFTTSSETPLEVGFASMLLDQGVSPYLNSFSFGFRPNSFEELDPYFAKFFFRSSLFRKDVVRLAQGSTRYNISKIAFMKIKLLLPSKNEQQKIAEFLTSLDEKISAIASELSRAKEFKKGLLQQMFV